MGLRVKVLALLVLAMFAALTTRLWFLQVLASEELKREAADNAVRLIEVPAPRGVIKGSSLSHITFVPTPVIFNY
jgi:cell division protein FtsI/penicillin-binding protein 2